ncbi:MAG: uracil-DNA glycosylase family protein, partial [Acutalibacteraceae bacterium]|nr:uracil-DNA glycosylase family protein [Acutalibacteraceae bacterium]
MSTWEELRQECLNCHKCGLCQTRTNVVFGVGKEDAEVMFIGEGPGQQEDLKGEPFVGRSGQLLDKLMATVDLFR